MILRLGVVTMFLALFPRFGAVMHLLQWTFLRRRARRLRVAPSRSLAWQFPKTIHTLVRPRADTEKSPRDPARRDSVIFFSMVDFWSVSGLLYFGNRHVEFVCLNYWRANDHKIQGFTILATTGFQLRKF